MNETRFLGGGVSGAGGASKKKKKKKCRNIWRRIFELTWKCFRVNLALTSDEKAVINFAAVEFFLRNWDTRGIRVMIERAAERHHNAREKWRLSQQKFSDNSIQQRRARDLLPLLSLIDWRSDRRDESFLCRNTYYETQREHRRYLRTMGNEK